MDFFARLLLFCFVFNLRFSWWICCLYSFSQWNITVCHRCISVDILWLSESRINIIKLPFTITLFQILSCFSEEFLSLKIKQCITFHDSSVFMLISSFLARKFQISKLLQKMVFFPDTHVFVIWKYIIYNIY